VASRVLVCRSLIILMDGLIEIDDSLACLLVGEPGAVAAVHTARRQCRGARGIMACSYICK